MVKNLPADEGDVKDMGSIPGSGRSPREGNDNPLHWVVWRISWTEAPKGRRAGHN